MWSWLSGSSSQSGFSKAGPCLLGCENQFWGWQCGEENWTWLGLASVCYTVQADKLQSRRPAPSSVEAVRVLSPGLAVALTL